MKKVFCDLRLCLGCKSCELACAVEHSKNKVLSKAIKETPRPKNRKQVEDVSGRPIPLGCQHCEVPACVDACMSGALYKDKQTGLTKQDADKCVGCWMCVMVCPFGALSRQTENKIALKCDLCPDREIPACVEACPSKALFVGTREEFEKRVAKKFIPLRNK